MTDFAVRIMKVQTTIFNKNLIFFLAGSPCTLNRSGRGFQSSKQKVYKSTPVPSIIYPGVDLIDR